MELMLALFALAAVLGRSGRRDGAGDVRQPEPVAGFGEFSRIGLCTTPAVLISAVLGLWAGIQLWDL